MKLLASLLGAAAADYACCPYDNFGVVFSGCPLTEKTPWAMDSNNADPMGVEHHMCKAWEANVDATFEGTEDYDNWGGCGFQRHFPWFWGTKGEFMEKTSSNGDIAANKASMHCHLGYMDCTGTNYATNYRGFNVGSNIFRLDTHQSPFTGGTVDSNGDHEGHAVVVGQVHLGAVCKLWIPVRLKFIDSVQISGVHMRGGGVPPQQTVVPTDIQSNDNHDGQSAAVFNDAQVCADGTCAPSTAKAHGTAYCFSVVNIAEFMENHHEGQSNKGAASFNVMNGNVAGKDSRGHDPIRLPGPVSRQEYDVHFGEPLDHTNVVSNALNGAGTIVESGANFDVVVHFKSQWCMRHWKIVDLQQKDDPAGSNNGHHDWGSSVLDYEVTSSNVNTPHHHHTDVADKRFDARVGICGCCNAAGHRHDDPNTHWDFTNHAPNPPVVGSTDAAACTRCDGAQTGSIYEGCDGINFYNNVFDVGGAHVNGGYKWPNAGAWAAFYSFITCSNHEFMIYDDVQTIGNDGKITQRADRDSSNQKRVAVHSMFYNDIRHDYSNNAKGSGTICIRGNIRQVGSKIVYCGPGIINTSSHDQSPPITAPGNKHNGDPGTNTQWLGLSNFKRCTWNWNFHEGKTTPGGVDKDPEHWFESDPSKVTYQRVWDTVAVPRGDDIKTFGSNGHDDYVTPVTETVTFTISFQNDFDQGPAQHAGVTYELFIDAPKYFTTPAQMAAAKRFTDLAATNPPDDGHYWTFTLFCLQSSLDGNGAKMPAAVNVAGHVGHDGWGLGHNPDGPPPAVGLPVLNNPITDFPDTADTQYRDLFPDCYMGDEIHFEYVIKGGSNKHVAPKNGNTDHRISAWFSHVEAKFQSSA